MSFAIYGNQLAQAHPLLVALAERNGRFADLDAARAAPR